MQTFTLSRVPGLLPSRLGTLLQFSAGLTHFAYRLLAELTGSQERMNRVTQSYAAFEDCLPLASTEENRPVP